VPVEVILVEWCPLPEAPQLAAALGAPPDGGSLEVRVVTVPAEVASSRFEQSDEIALWIFAAKNVGIRRARAPFVLATNPDVLYTPALFRAIAKRPLAERSFYRASRFDVDGVPTEAPPRRQLAAARRSIVRVNLIGGSVSFERPSGGKEVRERILRYSVVQEAKAPTTLEERSERPTEWLHTNASGDFFLMHGGRWADLHGYPEFASAGHLDSYMCAMAASAGLEQVILDGRRRRLYHLEHRRAIDWEQPESAAHYYVPYDTFLADARAMLLGERVPQFNGPDWGLEGVELPEATLRW
jgi:hypothetical protein